MSEIQAYSVDCTHCGHAHVVAARLMPRSGLFTLRCRSCRERFEGDVSALSPRAMEPPRLAPRQAAAPRLAPPEPTGEAPVSEDSAAGGSDSQEAHVATGEAADELHTEVVRMWLIHGLAIALGVLWALVVLIAGKAGVGGAGLVLGAAWLAATTLGWRAYRGAAGGADRLGVALAALQLVGALIAGAAGLYAAWEIALGNRIPFLVRGVFAWQGRLPVLIHTLLATALVLASFRHLRAERRMEAADDHGRTDRRVQWAGALLVVFGLGVAALSYLADFHHRPRIGLLTQHGPAFALLGLVTALAGLQVWARATPRRGKVLAVVLLVVALVCSAVWRRGHVRREADVQEATSMIKHLELTCPNRHWRSHRARRKGKPTRALLENIPARWRDRLRAASEPGVTLYNTNPLFHDAVDRFWRRQNQPDVQPADMNFCHYGLQLSVKNQLARSRR